MAIDTPARIAVLGAGPIGIETALYARFLGYDVELYERGEVAEHVRRWGHVRMFSPFQMNRSPLGLAAIAAQDESYRPPGDDELLTGHEWIARYLAPLAATDLLSDHLHRNTTVVRIGRAGLLKGEMLGDEDRGDFPFRILLRDAAGVERIAEADAVIDTTGVFGCPNDVGEAGMPALGELALRAQIEYGLPDVQGARREEFANRTTLVVGGGYSAATTVVSLAALAGQSPATRVVWVTRREVVSGADGPISRLAADRLRGRDQLAETANRLARANDIVRLCDVTAVHAMRRDAVANQFQVELVGKHAGALHVDRIVANVGYHPDTTLFAPLHVHLCYASDAPMKLAAGLLSAPPRDCLDQPAHGPAALLTPEPHFYVLGAKSYGRQSQFLVSHGLTQIRDLFRIIGDRPTLDLYATAPSLP